MQDDTHSFVIRIWHEEVDGEGRATIWRGSVNHVGSNQRLYVDTLEQIARFIQEQALLKEQHSSPSRSQV